DDLLDRRGVEEGQEGAGEDQHHQGEQGDLTEQERPVVGEHLAEGLAGQAGRAQPLVQGLGRAVPHRAHQLPRFLSQNAGPTGSGKSPWATSMPSSSTPSGSWGRGRAAGPKNGLAPLATSN